MVECPVLSEKESVLSKGSLGWNVALGNRVNF